MTKEPMAIFILVNSDGRKSLRKIKFWLRSLI
jgi:hypothetical protein